MAVLGNAGGQRRHRLWGHRVRVPARTRSVERLAKLVQADGPALTACAEGVQNLRLRGDVRRLGYGAGRKLAGVVRIERGSTLDGRGIRDRFVSDQGGSCDPSASRQYKRQRDRQQNGPCLRGSCSWPATRCSSCVRAAKMRSGRIATPSALVLWLSISLLRSTGSVSPRTRVPGPGLPGSGGGEDAVAPRTIGTSRCPPADRGC